MLEEAIKGEFDLKCRLVEITDHPKQVKLRIKILNFFYKKFQQSGIHFS